MSRCATFTVILAAFWLLPVLGLAAEPIQGAADTRWRKFVAQLRQLESGKPAPPLHILQLGDSHTAGDFLTDRLRQRLQQKYGNAGPGFLPPGLVKNHRVSQVLLQASPEWRVLQKRGGGGSASDLAGLGGYSATASAPYQTLLIELPESADFPAVSLYSRGGNGPQLYQDGVEQVARRLAVGEAGAYRSHFELAKPGRSISLMLKDGGTEVLGVTWLGRHGGVSFSSVGANGASLDILQEWDGTLVQAQLRDIPPALILLAFGTNDAFSPKYSDADFQASLEKTTAWLQRHAPQAAVLLLLPPDALLRSGPCTAASRPACQEHAPAAGKCALQSHPNLALVRAGLRKAAARHQWRTWDWSALTGRQCGAKRWEDHGEALYRPDGVHLTRTGYELSGDALFEALTAGR